MNSKEPNWRMREFGIWSATSLLCQRWVLCGTFPMPAYCVKNVQKMQQMSVFLSLLLAVLFSVFLGLYLRDNAVQNTLRFALWEVSHVVVLWRDVYQPATEKLRSIPSGNRNSTTVNSPSHESRKKSDALLFPSWKRLLPCSGMWRRNGTYQSGLMSVTVLM